MGRYVIGFGHLLTEEETLTGKVIIDGKPVSFRNGITEEQGKQLLEEDLKPFRRYIEEVVTVKLTNNQKDVLASLVYNIGKGNFQRSTLLKKLNAGKYEEIPEQIMIWAKASGKEIPSLINQRKDEIELWNKP